MKDQAHREVEDISIRRALLSPSYWAGAALIVTLAFLILVFLPGPV